MYLTNKKLFTFFVNKQGIHSVFHFSKTSGGVSLVNKNSSSWSDKIFLYSDFTETNFSHFIMENLLPNRSYSILIKLGFEGRSFYMIGSQIGISVKNSHNINYYKNLYEVISFKINDLNDRYDINRDPDTVHILFKSIDVPSSLVKLDKNSILSSLNKSVFKKSSLNQIFSSNYLPLSMDSSKLGYLIEQDLKLKYVGDLIKTFLNYGLVVPDILKNQKIIDSSDIYIKDVGKTKKRKVLILNIDLTKYISLYLNHRKTETFIKNSASIDYKIYTYHLNEKGYVKFIYDLNTGISLYEALDIKKSDVLFRRTINNYSLNINTHTGKVVDISRFVKMDYIRAPRFNNTFSSNPNIGVLDVETFVNSAGLGQVYCIGFATLADLKSDTLNSFYLSDFGPSLNSNMLIINCINSMLDPKYNNYYWYIHNMGKFDIIYIYKTLVDYNLISNNPEEDYLLTTTYKGNKMLRLVIKKKYKNKYIKITFLDSYNILSSSLDVLTKDFKVNYLKGSFPYSFVTQYNLNYIGQTPDIKYYNNISNSEYIQHYSQNNWSLKDECLKYLKNDIFGLLEVLDKFKSYLFIEHNLELTEGLTISRLALNKFLNFYLKDSKIPLINKFNIFNFIYEGYYGGRTEVFIPQGKNLNYYDVNSLYPDVSLLNMPGINVSYIKSLTDEGLDITNLFGMFKAQVKTNNNSYLGLLPVKSQLGLIFPNGEFEGIWSSVELNFAIKNGYNIKIIEGYNFDEVPSYFTDYVLDLFNLKAKTTGSERIVNKSLLNNLIGRFGLNILKPISKTVDASKLDYLLSTRTLNSMHEINKNTFLVNYLPIIDKKVCSDHGLDYFKVLNNEKNNSNLEKHLDVFNDVSIIIAAIITSYARVFMLQIMLDIVRLGGKIYYTDTDSIVTDMPLERLNPDLVGNGLGQFKLEHLIKEGYFITNKTYCLVLNNNSTIIVCKGVKNNSLTLEDFKSMYYSNKNILANKNSTITNLSLGSVIITENKVLLQHDAYTKREKIYNEKGLWVETRPILYNNIIKSIVKK